MQNPTFTQEQIKFISECNEALDRLFNNQQVPAIEQVTYPHAPPPAPAHAGLTVALQTILRKLENPFVLARSARVARLFINGGSNYGSFVTTPVEACVDSNILVIDYDGIAAGEELQRFLRLSKFILVIQRGQ